MNYLYDVYGVGNALVDMEFKVPVGDLQKLGVEKGLMTLVDEDRHHELLHKLHGENRRWICGGSAANTIIAVSQLGGKCFYSCKVANDETGDFYYKDLLAQGVATNLKDKRPDGHSGKCLVFVTPDADRTMNTFLGITATLAKTEIVPEEIKKSKYIYIEGYLVASPTGKEAAIYAREIAESAGVKTALTFSDPNMVKFFKTGLMEMIGNKVDLLFCNEAEAATFVDAPNFEAAIEPLKKIANTFAITLGKRGSFVFDGKESKIIEATPVKAVDTNGAGDMFAGAFLSQIVKGKNYFEAAKLANKAAGILVTNFGPRITNEQAVALRKESGI